jgi:hypothetical protein
MYDGVTWQEVTSGYRYPYECSFDTEEEAILSLMKDGKTFREFVILKTVYIINYE